MTTENTDSSAAERAWIVAESAHSVRMEGLDVSAATLADADSYIAGDLSSAEVVQRVLARYGVDPATACYGVDPTPVGRATAHRR